MNTNSKIGKLILVETKQKPEEELLLINILDRSEIAFCQKSNKEGFFKFGNSKFSFTEKSMNNDAIYVIKPIIICDDEIKVGWKGLAYKENVKGKIFEHFYTTNTWYNDAKIILVQSNQFSQEFLQAIVEGKVKDGDKVEVEMVDNSYEGYNNIHDKASMSVLIEKIDLKLRKDGTAIIHPYQETIEEAANNAISKLSSNIISRFSNTSIEAYNEGFFKGWELAIEWQKNQKK